MVSYDSNYEGVTQYCTECGKQMSSFQIGTDELKSSDDSTKGMCSDCAIPDERERFGSEIIEKNLEACGYPSVSDEYEESGCCPRCGEDPCVCGIEEHPHSYYSDPPGEHECHDDSDYDDVPYYGPEDSGVSSDYTRAPDDFCRESKYPPGDVRNIDFDSCYYRPSWDETYDEFDGEW